MRVFDCFIYNDEIDVLKIRLEELYPVVDKFIIVEGTHTFQGERKSDYGRYLDYEWIDPYTDKICGRWVNLSGTFASAWDREYAQRNGIAQAILHENPDDDDIILISDADEIPRRSVIAQINPRPVQSIALNTYYYGINVSGGHYHTIRAARYSELKNSTPQAIRTLDPPPDIVYDGGWHFSYLGPVSQIVNKFKSFSHTELNRPDTTSEDVIRERMLRLKDLWGDGHTYERVTVDETWPEAVKRDRKYWNRYEY